MVSAHQQRHAPRNEGMRAEALNLAIRKKEFTYDDISAGTGTHYKTVHKIVGEWLQAGVVTKIEHGGTRGNKAIFRVNPSAAVRHEALSAMPKPTKHGNMWHSMRSFPNGFSAIDVQATSNTTEFEVTEDDAKAYCQMLVRSGHLKVLRKALPGRREAVYRLIRNTGPRPPREVRLRAILDDNTGQHHLPDHVK